MRSRDRQKSSTGCARPQGRDGVLRVQEDAANSSLLVSRAFTASTTPSPVDLGSTSQPPSCNKDPVARETRMNHSWHPCALWKAKNALTPHPVRRPSPRRGCILRIRLWPRGLPSSCLPSVSTAAPRSPRLPASPGPPAPELSQPAPCLLMQGRAIVALRELIPFRCTVRMQQQRRGSCG